MNRFWWKPARSPGALMLIALSLRAPLALADGAMPAMHGKAPSGQHAPLFDNLGAYHRTVTTASPEAQRYFDQGMDLLWGFNLEEAQRSFEAAAALDSSCASCWWGVAMSLGPHVNLGGIPERTVPAAHAARRAAALAAGASEVERALIEAVQKRYSDPAPADPASQFTLDSSYAEAMRGVAARFPADNDVQALCAEALMDLHPWDYWKNDGTAQPWTAEILQLLDGILARDPSHPGANHYDIHALEASPHPEKALASADRLRDLMPGAGHMVHMPSHIYQRMGRYDDAAAANRKAVEADHSYAAAAHPQGFYHMYMSHNSHFLSWTCMVQGRFAEALRASRAAAAQISPEMAMAMPGTDFFMAEPVFVLARFGKWEDLAREPAPPKGLPFLRAIWHYGRGLGYTGLGRMKEAERSLDSLIAIRDSIPADAIEDLNSSRALLSIAVNVLSGEISLRRVRTDEAIQAFRAAVAGEDATRYSEAADWLYPARHHLGKALLAKGRVEEAEAVYREDLTRNPENGWALCGLEQSLRRQGKTIEADDAEARFKKAWSRADVTIVASAY
jgi:tetratricopeptide (TPR) repeat protein